MSYENSLLKQNPHWENKKLPYGIERTIKAQICRHLSTRHILVLTGARRSGKSYILYQLINHLLEDIPSENILYVNFDDPELTGLAKESSKLAVLYDDYLRLKNPKGAVYFFMDEIQSVAGWEKWVKSEYDREAKIKFIVTGSNSTLLSSELSTLLTGRHLQFEVFPFSFEEFLHARAHKIKTGNINDVYQKNHSRKGMLLHYIKEILEFGTFPEVVLSDQEFRSSLLKRYYKDIIYRDVAPRFEIRDIRALEDTAYYLVTNISNLASYAGVGKNAGVNEKTAKEYFAYFEKAYLFFQVPLYACSVKSQVRNPKKIYCIDSGMRNAASFRFSEDIGRLAENLVFMDLRARGCDIYYWKGKGEVDFAVFSERKVRQLIQVCWDLSDEKILVREKKSLIEAMLFFGLDAGIILTDNQFKNEIIDGRTIKYIPLWAWLLRAE